MHIVLNIRRAVSLSPICHRDSSNVSAKDAAHPVVEYLGMLLPHTNRLPESRQ